MRRNQPPPRGWSPPQTSRRSLWSTPWRRLLRAPFGRGACLRSRGSVDFILPTTQPFSDGCCHCRYIHAARSQVAERTAPPAAWSSCCSTRACSVHVHGQSVQLDVGASSMLANSIDIHGTVCADSSCTCFLYVHAMCPISSIVSKENRTTRIG